jgi:IS30 family transposase
MRHHTHLTLEEREDIMCLVREDKAITQIAHAIGKDKSTISRELKRNSCKRFYRASTAQKRYEQRRLACRRHRLLENATLFELVRSKFLEDQWSPEQIEGRLRLEGTHRISDSTIYRGIKAGLFDGCIGGKKAARRLRRKGRKRRSPSSERRGKIIVVHDITDRPQEAEDRSRLGDWEADTVAGKGSDACLVTLVDRKSRFVVGGKARKKKSVLVNKVIIKSLKGQPKESITPDRGKEFAAHAEVTEEIGVEFYFALPHHPWQRGTSENTSGLLREYFPKGRPLEKVSVQDVQEVYDKLNLRPRKRLGYRTPYEVHYSTSLQLL